MTHLVGGLLIVGHVACGPRLTARLGTTLLVVGYALFVAARLVGWSTLDTAQQIERFDRLQREPLAGIAFFASFGAWLGSQPSEYSSPKHKLRVAAIITALMVVNRTIIWVRTGQLRSLSQGVLYAWGPFNFGVLATMYVLYLRQDGASARSGRRAARV